MVEEYGHFINGEWLNNQNKKQFETINPATGELLARFPLGTREDVHLAIKSAREAFSQWRKTPAPERGEIILKAAQLMEKRKNELGKLVTIEMGKVIKEGLGDVQESIDFLKYISGEGRRLFGETTPSELKDKFCMTVRQPKGVIACITPWNFPMAIPIWKIGAALICGNTIVFKPASYTPLCAAKLVEIFHEVGLPNGVLNMVTGSGSVVGNEIVNNPEIKSISFTGSVETGIDIYKKGAERLVHVHLELGGKNPIIVMNDANLDLALEGVLWGAFGTAGQRCTAASRLIIHREVYNKFLDMLLNRIEKFRVGNPLDNDIDMGPVVSSEQEKKVLEYIEIGKKENGQLRFGGRKLTGNGYDKGYYIAPTIFETQHGTKISKEEIFGPVLAVLKAENFDEAIHIANDVEYGLSSSIYTNDINLSFKAIELLETGITYINAPTIGAEVHLPFGGIKHTGNGSREAGSTAIDEFSEIKTVFIDYSGRLQKAQKID